MWLQITYKQHQYISTYNIFYYEPLRIYTTNHSVAIPQTTSIYIHFLNCAPTCSVVILVLYKFIILWRSRTEVKMLCPTRLCRRFSRKQQRRRRSGRSLQLPHWFITRHSPTRHVCMYTYVLRTTKYIRRKYKAPPGGQVLAWAYVWDMCAKVQVHLL